MLPPPIRGKMPLRDLAAWLNQLLLGVKQLRPIAGNGLTSDVTETGVRLSLSRDRVQRDLEAIITAVHTTGEAPYRAADVTYEAVAVALPETTIGPVAPTYGRPCTDDGAIEPAKVNDRAWIIRHVDDAGVTTAQLKVASEKLVVSAECE